MCELKTNDLNTTLIVVMVECTAQWHLFSGEQVLVFHFHSFTELVWK